MPDLSTRTLPVLPLSTGVVLPGMVVTLALETDEAKAAVDAAGDSADVLLVPRQDGRYARVGTIAHIEGRMTLPGGTPALVVRGEGRAAVGAGVVGTGSALWVEVAEVEDPPASDRTPELAREYRAVARALLDALGARRLTSSLADVDEPGALADTAAWLPDLSFERKVELLETVDVDERLERATTWAKEALGEIELAEKIRSDVTDGMETRQREFLLRQQMAAIRKELGEDDDDPVAEYRARLADRDLPADVVEAVERELGRLERSSEQNPAQGWIRTWLDTVLDLPWDQRTDDDLDLIRARGVLDADHTGLDEVKERVVEFLAVRKLRAEREVTDEGADGDQQTGRDARRAGAIVALVGPPGVGKTSLGESVARALGRKFVRVALGGVRDEAEIRGHRRTYVGAQPGRIVRALVEAGSMNPVVLLDEIDKVGSDWRGDPSSALLEVLDPAQNHTFRDHYLEIDLDLSDVLFIATANVLDTVPGPLLDRLEIVRLDGYTDDEKVTIARDHLLHRQATRNGLRDGEVEISDEALEALVEGWTREPGVRELERQLGKVLRKAATKIATDEAGEATVTIGPDELRDALGRPRFDRDEELRVTGPGVARGLAVTGAGGETLVIEATTTSGEAGLEVTGQLGDVMQESARIARTWILANQASLGLVDGAVDKRLHLHVPAGAVPKDGPSAGTAMTTALVSLLSGRPVRPEVAMTGEVTLQGRVLPIGGVKQKVLAAHRAGITDVILPARNGPDLDDVPDAVRSQVTVHLVDHVSEALDLALQPATQAATAVAA
jgi:ATP-dependent Lon protease